MAIPMLAFIVISFVKSFPNDLGFTFDNYVRAFSPYSSVSIIKFLTNSLIISVLTAIVGTIIAYISGYISTRTKGVMTKPVHLLSIATLAVPGLVLGVGYIFLFKFTKGMVCWNNCYLSSC